MKTNILLLGLAISSCTCKEQNDAQLMPKGPPPPHAEVPADLSISVEIDGKPGPTIDKKVLDANKPSFENEEHRAWTIAELFGPALAEKSMAITVRGDNDLSITMPRPHKDRTLEPVLMLSRRGEVSAAMVSPADPFPAFHGQGRRLERGGDPLPRLSGPVKKILVTSTDKEKVEEREQVTDIKPLGVKIDSKDAEPWTIERLHKVNETKANEPGVSRDAWSLRDAAKVLVGPKARVIALVNAEDERMELAKSEWNDPSKTPSMRVNRQGQFKFQWSGANPMLGGASELRNVRMVEIVVER